MTCTHFHLDQIRTQVDASFSPFGHPAQVNVSWVTSINLLSPNEIQDMSALKYFFFATFVYLRKNVRVRLAFQGQFLLNLWLLASPFDQSLTCDRFNWEEEEQRMKKQTKESTASKKNLMSNILRSNL